MTSAANLSAASFRAALSRPQLSDVRGEAGLLLCQAGDPVIVALQFREPGAGSLGPREHGGHAAGPGIRRARASRLARRDGFRSLPCAGCLAGWSGIAGPGNCARSRGRPAEHPDQAAQRRPAFLHGGEPDRVRLHRLGVGGQVRRYVGDQVHRLGHPGPEGRQGGVVMGRGLQRLPGHAEQGDRVRRVELAARRVAKQGLVGGRGRRVQRVGVRKPLLLGEQLDVLAVGGLRLLDLGQAVSQVLSLPLPLPGLRGQLVELAADLTVPLVGTLVAGQQRGEVGSGEAVQRLALPAGLEQLLLTGLTVHGDQVVGQVGEQRHRDRPAAGVGTGTPLGRNRAAQDQRAALVVEVTA